MIKNKYLKLVLSSFAAGVIMAIASFELVMMDALGHFVAGGLLQGFGLAAVLALNLDLYNSHICDIFRHTDNKKEKIIFVTDNIIRLIINVLTVALIGMLLRTVCLKHQGFIESADRIAKLRYIEILGYSGDPWYDPLIGATLCGIIVGTGILISTKVKHPFLKTIIVFLSVGIYVVCGFEHVLTNTFYFAFSNNINPMTFVELLFVIIGNTLGAILVYLFSKLLKKEE